jgi:anti-sigma factor RsiW
VQEFFQGRVPVPVSKPPLPSAAAECVGARLGKLGARDAAQFKCRVGRRAVTVLVFDPSELDIHDHEVFTQGRRGYNVVFVRHGGVGYAFTSDLDQDQMLQLVETSFSSR